MKPDHARRELCSRLRSRREEIENALLARVYAVADPADVPDREYVNGLRRAVATALDYGLEALEVGEPRSSAVPPALLAQARAAARSGVELETVLSRYFVGFTLILDFVIEEAEAGRLLDKVALRKLVRAQGVILEGLIAGAIADYRREASSRLVSRPQRRAERVRRLLAGELVDSTDLAYELGQWHVAVVAGGVGAGEHLRRLAGLLDRRLLSIPREDGTIWGWFGGQREVDREEGYERIVEQWPDELLLAVSEPAHGRAGWRLSHHQARTAFALARPVEAPVVRYSDVVLSTFIVHDQLLARSLRQLYLDPLEQDRDNGRSLRATLRAYLAANRNISSTAAALGVRRQTVRKRLERIEALLGRDLRDCTSELGAALRLEELENLGDGQDLASSPRPKPGGSE